MAFKDLLNKGMDLISKGAETAKKAAEDKKNAIHEFDLLKTKSDHIGPMNTYVVNNNDPQVGRETMILNACLTINVDNSRIINKLIPIDETIVDVKTGKEAKTEIQYAFAMTDKRLWVLNQKEYITYEFDNIKNFEMVNKGLMSQGVKFNDMAFVLDGTEKDVETFINNVFNPDIRLEAITRKIKYLCGITPAEQLLNANIHGITISKDNKIVLHNGVDNKLVEITDIDVVQLLINDSVVISRGRTDSGNIMSSPMEARKMSIKFVLKMGDFTVDILEQNMMNTTYRREEATYINNYEFAKKIIDKITEYLKN